MLGSNWKGGTIRDTVNVEVHKPAAVVKTVYTLPRLSDEVLLIGMLNLVKHFVIINKENRS